MQRSGNAIAQDCASFYILTDTGIAGVWLRVLDKLDLQQCLSARVSAKALPHLRVFALYL